MGFSLYLYEAGGFGFPVSAFLNICFGEKMKTKENNFSDKSTDTRWAIRPLVPREVYTDREEHLECLYKSA